MRIGNNWSITSFPLEIYTKASWAFFQHIWKCNFIIFKFYDYLCVIASKTFFNTKHTHTSIHTKYTQALRHSHTYCRCTMFIHCDSLWSTFCVVLLLLLLLVGIFPYIKQQIIYISRFISIFCYTYRFKYSNSCIFQPPESALNTKDKPILVLYPINVKLRKTNWFLNRI